MLDVGPNAVHLVVVDLRAGARPDAVSRHSTPVRLHELAEADGTLGEKGRHALVLGVRAAREAADAEGVEELLAYATSGVLAFPDGADALRDVEQETATPLPVHTEDEEAELTFLASRRWFGWSAGRLLCLDLGAGSLQVALGKEELPTLAAAVPLGTALLTRELLHHDPPTAPELADLRRHVWTLLESLAEEVREHGPFDKAVCTSKPLRSLGRLDGAAPYAMGPRVTRVLTRRGLASIVDRLTDLTSQEIAQLPGVSPARAGQLTAAAVVAHQAFTAFGVERAELSPWALREGVVLRRLDEVSD